MAKDLKFEPCKLGWHIFPLAGKKCQRFVIRDGIILPLTCMVRSNEWMDTNGVDKSGQRLKEKGEILG